MYYFNLERVKDGKKVGLIMDEFSLKNTRIKKVLNVVTRENISIINFEDENYILDMPSERFINEMQREK